MGEKQILIKCGKKWFEFSKSRTGQLDYAGKIEDCGDLNADDYQRIESSAYFSPGRYIYVQDELNCLPVVFVSSKTDILDEDIYDFLLHAGALLCAVEAKDSLLAGELYRRRKSSFEKFPQLTQFIIKPLAVEMLFSLMYGNFYPLSEDDVPDLLKAAKKTLSFDASKETVEQAFVRYFSGKKTTLTLPVVGTNHYRWSPHSEVFENLFQNITPDGFEAQLKKINDAKRGMYANLRVAVQAEPYNPADENAIAVMIENIDSKAAGTSVLEKSGYIRATAAKILRAANPDKMTFPAHLARLSDGEIAVQVEV